MQGWSLKIYSRFLHGSSYTTKLFVYLFVSPCRPWAPQGQGYLILDPVSPALSSELTFRDTQCTLIQPEVLRAQISQLPPSLGESINPTLDGP
jgi:hypothetical protein